MMDKETIRQRRRRILSREIEEIAIALFIENGYDNVTTSEIASAADISNRTFFRYFPSKEAILISIPHRILDKMCAAFEARPQDETIMRSWRAAAMEIGKLNDIDSNLVKKLLFIVNDSPSSIYKMQNFQSFKEPIVDIIAKRLNTDKFDLETNIIAAVVHSALSSAISLYANTSEDTDFAAVFSKVFDILDNLHS
ncbi:MAG: AcrR family transcriptional regulator [Zhongshania aliphaticivorans]|jgi:AcrR family transcriptional regulator|uniref:TetR family transcriptional regulator n=1 Tax=Zhongshania aliphaticivorans TaxID=1470434 RepID=UPI0039E410A6